MDIEWNKTEIHPLCFCFEQDFMWKWMKNRQYTLQDQGWIIEIYGELVAGYNQGPTVYLNDKYKHYYSASAKSYAATEAMTVFTREQKWAIWIIIRIAQFDYHSNDGILDRVYACKFTSRCVTSIAQFEWSFEWLYFLLCVRKLTSRCVIWIVQFKWRSGPSFELRMSNYTSRCNFAYTRSRIQSFEW